MASGTRKRSSASSSNGSATTRKPTRVYVVVEEKSEGVLKVVDPEREAKDQKGAMDAVRASLPPEQRTVRLGAFLKASYKARQYNARQEWVTEDQEVLPFGLSGGEPQS